MYAFASCGDVKQSNKEINITHKVNKRQDIHCQHSSSPCQTLLRSMDQINNTFVCQEEHRHRTLSVLRLVPASIVSSHPCYLPTAPLPSEEMNDIPRHRYINQARHLTTNFTHLTSTDEKFEPFRQPLLSPMILCQGTHDLGMFGNERGMNNIVLQKLPYHSI